MAGKINDRWYVNCVQLVWLALSFGLEFLTMCTEQSSNNIDYARVLMSIQLVLSLLTGASVKCLTIDISSSP